MSVDRPWLDQERTRIQQKYSEEFRKSLCYYVGAFVEWTPDDPQMWKKQVFNLVDSILVGIEHSSYELVEKT